MSLRTMLFGKMSPDQDGWTDAATLFAALKDATPPAIIDVRNPDEFAGPLGHINGATNVPLPVFEQHMAELVQEPRPVVLVCHTDRRSSMAAAALRKAGKQHTLVLRGGMTAWRAMQDG